MGNANLEEWLNQPRVAVRDAVRRCIGSHVAALAGKGVDFYGYALMPGEPYDVSSVCPAYNAEADLGSTHDDDYLRLSVNEWQHYEPAAFTEANEEIIRARSEFEHMRPPVRSDEFVLTEHELKLNGSLLAAILDGLAAAKSGGMFGPGVWFLCLWFTDDKHEIVGESVRRLNTPAVAERFAAEFGD